MMRHEKTNAHNVPTRMPYPGEQRKDEHADKDKRGAVENGRGGGGAREGGIAVPTRARRGGERVHTR